jgi:hypothetical protein
MTAVKVRQRFVFASLDINLLLSVVEVVSFRYEAEDDAPMTNEPEAALARRGEPYKD